MPEKSRLQKILASSGVASRRKAEGAHRRRAGDRQRSGGPGWGTAPSPARTPSPWTASPWAKARRKIYLALHKPRGFVTTLHDERGRKCVAQLVEGVGERVYPVGRLDKDSEGLLLLTNDGEFANRVAHPTRHVAKTYRVNRAALCHRGPAQPDEHRHCHRGPPHSPPPRCGCSSRSWAGWCWRSSSTRAATGKSARCVRPWAWRWPA